MREFPHLSVKQERVVEKTEIESILPHRGRMLLLDRVVITNEKVQGELLIREDICEGHAVYEGKLVFKGSDLLDMASQLLGIWAVKANDISSKKCVVREYGGATFKKPVFPGEKLILEIKLSDVCIKEGKIADEIILFITGLSFIAWVERKTRAYLGRVRLAAF